MGKLAFVYLCSFLMLCFYHKGHALRKPFVPQKRKPVSHRHKEMRQIVKPTHLVNLLIAYNTGSKKKLNRKMKKAHKTLHLIHLFTPSGIHLSALYLSLWPLFSLARKKGSILYNTLWFGTALFPFILSGLYSIKRMALLRILWRLNRKFKYRRNFFHLFLLTFFLDFIVGNFKYSPLSFIYSFLFLGIIAASSLSGKRAIYALFGGQIIVGFFDLKAMAYSGFLFGFILTGIFSIFFPIFFLFYWSLSFFPFNWGGLFVAFFWNLVEICSKMAEKTGFFHSSLPLVLAVFITSLNIGYLKKILFAFLLIIHSEPLFNLSHSSFMKISPEGLFTPPLYLPDVKKIHRTRRGYKIIFKSNDVCYDRIYEYFFLRSCK